MRNAYREAAKAKLKPAAWDQRWGQFACQRYSPVVLTRQVGMLLLADLVSTTGTEMTAVALPWLVLLTTDSPVRTGLVLAVEVCGLAAGGLPGGALLQRLGSKRMLLAADAVRAVAVGLVPVLDWAGGLSFAVLLAIAFVLGAPFSAHQAARQNALAQLAKEDEHQLTRLGALLSAANESASTIGPVLGGLLVVALGVHGVLALDAVSYLTAVALVAVALPQVADTPPTGRVLDGLRWLAADRPLRRRIGGLCVLQISFTALLLLIPVLTRTQYRGGATTAGLLLGAYGAGSVLGGLTSALRSARPTPSSGAPHARANSSHHDDFPHRPPRVRRGGSADRGTRPDSCADHGRGHRDHRRGPHRTPPSHRRPAQRCPEPEPRGPLMSDTCGSSPPRRPRAVPPRHTEAARRNGSNPLAPHRGKASLQECP